jgi:hypothetical protein
LDEESADELGHRTMAFFGFLAEPIKEINVEVDS